MSKLDKLVDEDYLPRLMEIVNEVEEKGLGNITLKFERAL